MKKGKYGCKTLCLLFINGLAITAAVGITHMGWDNTRIGMVLGAVITPVITIDGIVIKAMCNEIKKEK